MQENGQNFQNVAADAQPDPVNWGKEVFEWVACIAIAIIVALLIKNFVFTMVKVDGQSMDPTLAHGDRLFTRVMFYNEPEQGDIIIFNPSVSIANRSPQEDVAYVKRVIATEGQTVDITPDGDVVVDGKVLKENYISEKIDLRYHSMEEQLVFPYKVPKDTVFVLGDNRNHSRDSRCAAVGAVPLDNIIGKAQFRLWPLSSFGSLYE